ncbi:MAG TPA: ADOP family duplicated permease [Gemmatimonadaceae bacterium]|nr:ADOP family duplicated permease [Gemmatimonadaceae bacterium]
MPPPRLARSLLLAFVPHARRAEIDGDLLEGFRARVERDGAAAARRWYWQQLCTTDLLRLRALHGGRRVPDMTGGNGMMLQDLRFAARSLARSRLYTLAVVAVLAIGIGAVTAVFTLVHSVLLRPLPYRDADRLVMAFRTVPRLGFTRSTVSYPDYRDWRALPVFEDLAAYANAERTYHGPDGAESWRGVAVTGNLLPMLGAGARTGRAIVATDGRPDATPIVVLSHRTWQRSFGGNPDAIGRPVRLGEVAVTVIGVMPPAFDFPNGDLDFWVPLPDALSTPRDQNFLSVVGRLSPGVTPAVAQRELAAFAGRVDSTSADGNRGYGVFVEPRHAFAVRNVRSALIAFQLTVLLVLALACGGVANLMLSRGLSRRREMAVRTALGATRGRLLRHLMTESTVLAVAGGVLGVMLSTVLCRLVVAFGANQLPRLHEIRLDAAVLAAATAVTLLAALVCGLAPALQLGRTSLVMSMRLRGDSAVRARRYRLQDGLVVVQLALSVVLLVSAALVGRSFLRLTAIAPGFDPEGVVAGRVAYRASPQDTGLAGRDRFFEELTRRVGALPGVTVAGLTFSLPFSEQWFSTQMLPEDAPGRVDDAPAIKGSVVDGAYFSAIGMPLVRGRAFGPDDRAGAPRALIVSRSLAERFWPGQDPIGQRVRDDETDRLTVVGVVGDVHQSSLAEEPAPMYYVPLTQAGSWASVLFVVARSAADPAPLVPLIRSELRAINPALPLTQVATAGALIDRTIAAPRFRALTFTVLGAFAVLLAVAGIYGIVSLGVAERTREIGVRLALGAERGRVIAMVVGRGMRLSLAGVGLGVVGAVAATRTLESLLFGVTARDLPTFAAASAALLVVAVAASYLPARRASRVDPLVSLREG